MASEDSIHNIVVCCDGTWCGAETGTRSNIQIIADAFCSQGPLGSELEIVPAVDGKPVHNAFTNTDVCYFNGVGLSGREDLESEGKLPPLALGLLGGFADTLLYIKNCVIADDLSFRCQEAYGFIADRFKGPGKSRIWLFGLSRGAYTVRAVAGMINTCGIIKGTWPQSRPLGDPEELPYNEKQARRAALKDVWDLYLSNKQKAETAEGQANYEQANKRFSKHTTWERGSLPPVIFMGLLDTVGAKGWPGIDFDAPSADLYKYNFADLVVSYEVQHVFQVVSTHDRFAPFQPCPVRRYEQATPTANVPESCDTRHNYQHLSDRDFSMREVWYPGAHYDIGRQDFVLSQEPVSRLLIKLVNPLRTNVNCTPELADYPLLGRALPSHGGPKTLQHSDLSPDCLVAQVNKHNPGMLPDAGDAVWERLVQPEGNSSVLGAVLHSVQLFAPAYSIDAETTIFENFAGLVDNPAAKLLGDLVQIEPAHLKDVVLKDRAIPVPPVDRYGYKISKAEFFPVPSDKPDSFASYTADPDARKAGGRQGEWFRSRTFDIYKDAIQASAQGAAVARARL